LILKKNAGYKVEDTVLTVERLESIVASPFSEGFNRKENWDCIKNMAQKAILFANDYLHTYHQPQKGLFSRHEDHPIINQMNLAAKNLLQAPITSAHDLEKIFFNFFSVMVNAQEKLQDWPKKFNNTFLDDIYSLFNLNLGTLMDKGTFFKNDYKPLLPLTDYLKSLGKQLQITEIIEKNIESLR
jgi:hypothetical protein